MLELRNALQKEWRPENKNAFSRGHKVTNTHKIRAKNMSRNIQRACHAHEHTQNTQKMMNTHFLNTQDRCTKIVCSYGKNKMTSRKQRTWRIPSGLQLQIAYCG